MKRYFGAAAAALFLAALCRAILLALGVQTGLVGEYFLGEEHSGRPFLSTIDDEISTDTLTRVWRGTPPAKFNARWFGYLTVPATGRYTFTTSSDDGSY